MLHTIYCFIAITLLYMLWRRLLYIYIKSKAHLLKRRNSQAFAINEIKEINVFRPEGTKNFKCMQKFIGQLQLGPSQ